MHNSLFLLGCSCPTVQGEYIDFVEVHLPGGVIFLPEFFWSSIAKYTLSKETSETDHITNLGNCEHVSNGLFIHHTVNAIILKCWL